MLTEKYLKATLECELNTHLNQQERLSGNHRNGHTPKVQTSLGEVSAYTPHIRESTLKLEFIRKREPILVDDVDDRIIGLYAMLNSIHQISDWMEENLRNHFLSETISLISERVYLV